MIAQKLQPLIAAAAALTVQGRDVRQRAFQQRLIGEAIADRGLEFRCLWLRLALDLARRLARLQPAGCRFAASAAAARACVLAAVIVRRGSSNDLEQPVPAHRPGPAPDLPGALALADREEDDLRPADQMVSNGT